MARLHEPIGAPLAMLPDANMIQTAVGPNSGVLIAENNVMRTISIRCIFNARMHNVQTKMMYKTMSKPAIRYTHQLRDGLGSSSAPDIVFVFNQMFKKQKNYKKKKLTYPKKNKKKRCERREPNAQCNKLAGVYRIL